MKGMTTALFQIIDIQNKQLGLCEEQIKLLKEQTNYLLEKIKILDIEIYNELMA